jgi:uncharacterized membrane protein
MKAELINLAPKVWRVLDSNIDWMSWNLFLAFVPLDLSVSLFRRGRVRVDAEAVSSKVASASIKRWVWWLRCLIFLVFLPKASEVLTSAHLLAVLPLGLSVWLFYRGQKRKAQATRSRSWAWWLGFLAFFAFLPNAPYVLTDVIHLISDIRDINSVWMITLVVLPVYLLFILAGFGAYVLSLINFGYYLHQIGRSKWILAAELLTHALSAVGIYLGRFLRFNSWDFITQPDTLATSVVEDVLGKRPLAIIVITFTIVTLLYWIVKRVTLGILLPRQGANSTQNQQSGKTDSSTAQF